MGEELASWENGKQKTKLFFFFEGGIKEEAF